MAKGLSLLRNSLPEYIRGSASLSDFKTNIKTYLFKRAYGDEVFFSQCNT